MDTGTYYLFIVSTDDDALKCKSSVKENAIDLVLKKAKRIVKKYPEIIGEKFTLYKCESINGSYKETILKQDIIQGK